MEELTLSTLDHLVYLSKQIRAIYFDFEKMREDGISICSLAGECIDGLPTLHVDVDTLTSLSALASQKIIFNYRGHDRFNAKGSFCYDGVKFFALLTQEDLEAYNANS